MARADDGKLSKVIRLLGPADAALKILCGVWYGTG